MSQRTFNTVVREAWNPCIHHVLKAIDLHNECYFKDRNSWHLDQADRLRSYLVDLKTWIKGQEAARPDCCLDL